MCSYRIVCACKRQIMKIFLRYLNAALLLAAFAPALAQLPEPGANSGRSNTFGSHVDLVLVPVNVTDSKGHHVSGLKMESFHLSENGKQQALGLFEEITARKIDPDSAQSAAPVEGFSNFAARNTHVRRMTVLVLDLLNTPSIFQPQARKELMKYLSKSLDNDEPIALLGIDGRGLWQIHSFTTNTKVLIEALHRIRGKLSATEMNDNDNASNDSASTAALLDPAISGTVDRFEDFFSETMTGMAAMDQRDATRRTLTGLSQIALAFAGIPGRKTLIWATAGFPFMIDDPSSIAYMGLDMIGRYEQTWRALMSANVAVYPVDLQGVLPKYQNRSSTGTNSSASGRGGPVKAADVNRRSLQPWTRAMPYDQQFERQKTMEAFAAATGGITCMNFNDLAKCFEKAASDSSSYYLLGFYLSPDDRKPGWRKVKVDVTERGTRVRAREGFYVGEPPKENEEARKAAIAAALTSPVEFTGVPMNVQWTGRTESSPAAGGQIVSAKFSVTVPAPLFTLEGTDSGLVDLLFSAVAFNEKGREVAEISKTFVERLDAKSIAQVRRAGFAYQGVINYPAGTKEVRFAIRNNSSGDIGSVVAPVEAR